MPTGTITALRAQARDSQRVNVFIDHTFALGVSLDTLAREQLHVGQAIDDATWARLEASESASRAFRAALRLLQARPRAEAELRDRLRRKQCAPPAIDAAIERLHRLELLDDTAFARLWVQQRQATRPRAAARLRAELAQKGVERAVIDETLSDDSLVGDASAQADELARGVLARYQSAPDFATFQRRLGGYLQRRGFRYETIRPILAQLWEECQHPGD